MMHAAFSETERQPVKKKRAYVSADNGDDHTDDLRQVFTRSHSDIQRSPIPKHQHGKKEDQSKEGVGVGTLIEGRKHKRPEKKTDKAPPENGDHKRTASCGDNDRKKKYKQGNTKDLSPKKSPSSPVKERRKDKIKDKLMESLFLQKKKKKAKPSSDPLPADTSKESDPVRLSPLSLN
jgi:hypothetical protein